MELIEIKAALAVVLVGAALTALVSMLSLMGRGDRAAPPRALRTTHRVAGYAFTVSALALAALGVRLLSVAGDGLPLRSVLHWTAAVLLLVLLAIKIAMARRYRKLLNYVPPLGLAVFACAMIVAALSLGFVLVAGG